LGEHLIRCGHGVVLVSGVAAHENRKTLDGRWDTNDTRDAANVADLVSQGKCLFYEFPGGALQDLRNLLSLKRRLKRIPTYKTMQPCQAATKDVPLPNLTENEPDEEFI
jgi:transposase